MGRSNRQTTYDNLPAFIRPRVKLVVQAHEAAAHSPYPLIVLPDHIDNISDTRHWLIHKCELLKAKSLVMLDDDLVFSARRDDEPTKFRNMEDRDWNSMFLDLEHNLREYAHVGVSHREGANRNTNRYVECSRQMRVLGYQKDIMRANNITGRTKVMEDFDVTLQLLGMGLPNRLLNMWVHNQGGSDSRGGCSTFRTPAVQAEAAHELARLHPGCVKVREVPPKGGWDYTRTDVTVYWKKKYARAE